MPATHYTETMGPVGFVMLDTDSIMWDNTDNGEQIDGSPARWRRPAREPPG
jgi:hypothetical protein